MRCLMLPNWPWQISLGILKNSLRVQLCFLPLPNQRKRLSWGWEGSSLGKKKKKTMSWLYSPWRSSQLSMLPVIGSLWPKGGKGNTCQWMIIKPNKNIERLSVKNNILKVWVNKRSFLLHCLVTCQEETFQSWPVTARFWCSDGIFPACKAVSKLLLFKRTPIILD